MSKACEGCRTYRYKKNKDVFSLCKLRPLIHTNLWCPCVKCIVKSMCDTTCPAYNKYIEELKDFVEPR